jgi:hypothetical protein
MGYFNDGTATADETSILPDSYGQKGSDPYSEARVQAAKDFDHSQGEAVLTAGETVGGIIGGVIAGVFAGPGAIMQGVQAGKEGGRATAGLAIEGDSDVEMTHFLTGGQGQIFTQFTDDEEVSDEDALKALDEEDQMSNLSADIGINDKNSYSGMSSGMSSGNKNASGMALKNSTGTVGGGN